jgi:hypothetical protein
MTLPSPSIPHSQEFSETSEANASDTTRAIYNEIKTLSGVPMVALIYRHLATYPGVLEEAWEAIGPFFRNGRIQEIAWRTAESTVPAGLLPPFEINARQVLGVSDDALMEIRRTIEAYNRANPVNQLAMLSLLARLSSDAPAKAPLAPRDWRPPAAIAGPLPRMAPINEISPAIRLVINDFGFGDRSTLDPIVPSLFRHLTSWPNYLAALNLTLRPHFRDGRMAHATNDLQAAMAREASTTGAFLPPLKHVAANPHAISAISHFSGAIIPMMTVIGYAMFESLI